MHTSESRIASFANCGYYSSVWNYNGEILKITEDQSTIDFYNAVQDEHNPIGLPDICLLSDDTLNDILFDVTIPKGYSGTVPNVKSSRYRFLKDAALLSEFHVYKMPKYQPLSPVLLKHLNRWYQTVEDKDIGICGETIADLEEVIKSFKKVIPSRCYYPDSLDFLNGYLLARNNWSMDLHKANFLMDANGKLVFLDPVCGSKTNGLPIGYKTILNKKNGLHLR